MGTARDSFSGRPKVACVIDGLARGGDASHLLTLLRFGLVTRAETHVVSIAPVGESAFDFQKAGAAVHALDLPDEGGPKRALWTAVAAVRTFVLLRELAPRLVLVLGERAMAVAPLASRMAGVPWVTTIVRRPSTAPAFRNLVARLFSNLSDHFLVTGSVAAEEAVLRLGAHPKRLRFGGEGLDLGHFVGNQPLDLPRGVPHVGLVMRLTPNQVVPVVFDAAEILLRFHPDLRITIVGGGPQGLAWLRDTQRRGLSGRITLRGEEHDVPEFLAALDVFVLPSPRSGQSRAVLEAMAAKVPVVAADAPWLAAHFRHEEELLYFDPERPSSLADAIDRVVSDLALRTGLISRAFDRVRRDHRASDVVARMMAALPLSDAQPV